MGEAKSEGKNRPRGAAREGVPTNTFASDEGKRPPRRPSPVSETDLIIALFRLVVVLVVLTGSLAASAIGANLPSQVYVPTVGLAVVNALLILAYRRGIAMRWCHPVIVVLELYALALWMEAWGTFARNLFVVYYLPALITSLRFGYRWGVPTAIAAVLTFLWIVPGSPQLRMAYLNDMLYAQFLPLLIISLITGFLTAVREREREAAVERERILAEFSQRIELARQVQESTLPATPPQVAGYRIGATVRAADYAVGGGDFYDVADLPHGRYAFCVADVAGKTISGVAKLPLVKWGFRLCAELYPDVGEMARRLNEVLCRNLEEDTFVALFLGTLDGETGELRYVNAGQVAPVLFHSGEMETLGIGGPAQGISQDARYASGTARLFPGDVLIACTDGVIPASNPLGDGFLIDWVLVLGGDVRYRDPQDLAETIRAEVERQERGTYRDDLAVLVIKRLSTDEHR